MTDADFDIIVVGSGCAGAVAAYEAATSGKSVLVVERGNFAGAKNMTGGRIYSHALKAVFPEFEKSAPIERRITHERISLMDPEANFTIDFTSKQLAEEGQDSYAVLRGPFDQWLAKQAEDAGAEYIYGIAVEGLVKEGDRVVGVSAAGDEITAHVVILADGVNSLLSSEAVGAQRPAATMMAVGLKETIELPQQTISDRLLTSDDEGAAWLFAGDATKGHFGGGFMYTNKESISLGIVAGIEGLSQAETPIYQMMDDFKKHPAVAPLIQGGKLVEYSGHMVPEGGYNMIPDLFGDGILVTGDAAMLCINLGYMVRGMDFAVAAGQMAAQAACEAIDAKDTSAAGLAGYRAKLENSFVLKDLKSFQKVPDFMEGFTRMFNEYPLMIKEMMNNLFVVDGQPVQPMMKKMMPSVKKIGYGNLFKDVRGAMKSL